ncbi:MAG: DMT family transporter [Gaiella sp.]|nr:DMT family transporter [Gaiella sp.]
MDAVVLAFASAALFGAMPVAVRYALPHPLPVIAGTVIMQVGTFAVLALAALVQGGITVDGALPFFLVGAIAPGLSQIFIMLGIRDAGSARASLVFGCAPLFAVALAVGVFGERPGPEILLGALLVVGGGLVLAMEGVTGPRTSARSASCSPPSGRRSSPCGTTSSATSRWTRRSRR